jgi:hypothetical protein
MTTIITAVEAADILGVSRQRVSQLLKQGIIGSPETGIELDMVTRYKYGRNKPGRPVGTYKKRRN